MGPWPVLQLPQQHGPVQQLAQRQNLLQTLQGPGDPHTFTNIIFITNNTDLFPQISAVENNVESVFPYPGIGRIDRKLDLAVGGHGLEWRLETTASCRSPP